MELSKRSFLLLPLLVPSFKAFSCTFGPSYPVLPYSEKTSRFSYIGNSAEEFLNNTYGHNNWRYDDNLFVTMPERYEIAGSIPFETGAKKDSRPVVYTALTIYAEEHIPVVDHGYNPNDLDSFKKIQYEKRVFEVAKFNFHEKTHPYVATRLNLSGLQLARAFCVFTTNKVDRVHVAIQPKPTFTHDNPCAFIVYERG